MLQRTRVLVWAVLIGICGIANGQDARQFVTLAVQTELAADAADHTNWLYYEVDRKPGSTVKQWVADTRAGALYRVLENNGQRLTRAEQQSQMDAFRRDPSAQAKQRRSGRHDDQQATQMLGMLPHAFIWTRVGSEGDTTVLHFKPDPNFSPPTWESRVFAAMEGNMKVDNAQHRIVSLQGRMIHDVKFAFGLFGDLRAGGTFDVERRQTGKGEWQITETHVHIEGHALLFKSISEEEDDEKSQLKQLPGNISLADAEKELLAQPSLDR